MYTTFMRRPGLTLVEISVVVALMGLLSSIVYVSHRGRTARARLTKVEANLATAATAMFQYAADNGYVYPPDTSRALPSGIEPYLSNSNFSTEKIFPYGVFDYDNWTISGQKVYQVSYRLCNISDPDSRCSDPVLFPDFVKNSAIYYCISGNCIPHESSPTAPAYCVTCPEGQKNKNRAAQYWI